MNIHWTEEEKNTVKKALKGLLLAGKYPKGEWPEMLYHAQKALAACRQRRVTSLSIRVWMDKANAKRWGSARDIVVEALRDLGIIPVTRRRWEELPHRHGLRVPQSRDAANDPVPSNNPQAATRPTHPALDKEAGDLRASLKAIEAERDEARASLAAVQKQCAQSEMEAEELRRRLDAMAMERDRALASHAAMEKQLAQSETMARLQALERDVWAIHEFLTSQGYKPHVGQVRKAA